MLAEDKTFLSIFSKIEDPRQENANKKHLLIDVLAIAVCAVICGKESWYDVAEFGIHKEKWFKKFLDLPNGIPSHDTFRRVFMILDPKKFNASFVEWSSLISKKFTKEVIAIDGKTLRGSGRKNGSSKSIHMVSAWATENGLVLSQLGVDEKSNEITAIPELLKSIDVANSIVTIDAMGCQKEIVSAIRSQQADYVLALKKNHSNLYQNVKDTFEKGFETDFKDMKYSHFKTTNLGHGRYEERNYYLLEDVNSLPKTKEWEDLNCVGVAESRVTRDGKKRVERRYFITSLKHNAEEFGHAVRTHWHIENCLHWVLDVHFNDDHDYKREKNSATNFGIVKRVGLNLLKTDTTKKTIKSKQGKAAQNEEYLEFLLTGQGNV